MKPNRYFLRLSNNYLFTEIALRTEAYQCAHPDKHIIRLGVGDVTRPLPAAIVEAMHNAVAEMGDEATFRGYPPEVGWEFLRQAIVDNDYKPRGIDFGIDEVFISQGAADDLGNLSELFERDNRVAILDPVYPAYVDTNIMAGREIDFIPCLKENGFVPELPRRRADIIYLCFPNNPIGTALSRGELQVWVDYALANRSLIIFDSAYETYIEQADVPHSIYELSGAKHCAIEIRSYSKSAGFTGMRCAYTVVPKELVFDGVILNSCWARRQCTKSNGVSYITQRAAVATYSAEGREGLLKNMEYYKRNCRLLKQSLQDYGFEVYGGVNSPYIWLKTMQGLDSWQFFDFLLDKCQIVCTPGVGFGPSGEGFVRLTSFGRYEDTLEAVSRLGRL